MHIHVRQAVPPNSGRLPQRGGPEGELRSGVRVRIFDWGRTVTIIIIIIIIMSLLFIIITIIIIMISSSK